MAELFPHQREALAVARHRNVLLCSAQRVGKTFLVAMRVREWLHAEDAAAPSSASSKRQLVVAIASTVYLRDVLQFEIARLCSEPLWTEGPATTSRDPIDRRMQRLSDPAVRVAIMAPETFQSALRKPVITIEEIGLLVLEGVDQIQDSAPSLYRQAFENAKYVPRILATTTTPASSLDWNPAVNPLFRHIHVLNLMPVVSPDAVMVLHGHAPPRLPLLLGEPFHTAAAVSPNTSLTCTVRDFLLGENDKKLDFVRVFRTELELGNSAAIHDEKKKQDRVNRFIQDAESVYEHLGLWCLIKHVELELQINLTACFVEDTDNINHRRRQYKLEQRQKNGVDASKSADEGDVNHEGGEEEAEEAEEGEEQEEDVSSVDGDGTLVAFVEEKLKNLELDDARVSRIKQIMKVLTWLSNRAASIGAEAATPRLLKAAALVRGGLSVKPFSTSTQDESSSSSLPLRSWVFVERRVHCSVVAEYLSFALSDLKIPPCCSMLGGSHARIVGALHFSTFLKVITRFDKYETNVLVTTSISRASQRIRVDTPLCDLVVVMDELLESDKLLEYCQRANTVSGVVKYIHPQGPQSERKFQLLVSKMMESAQLEGAATVAPAVNRDSSASRPAPREAPPTTVMTAMIHAEFPPSIKATDSVAFGGKSIPPGLPRVPSFKSPAFPAARPVSQAAPPVTYELVYSDTGAVLNLINSVDILSEFCETLPGLDTYDRRPQYKIKRTPIAGVSLSTAAKQAKKKKLKYNSKLHDKIDDITAQAEARTAAKGGSSDADEQDAVTGRFQFSAKLILPRLVGAKKEIGSPIVFSDTEAKAIAAYKGVLELIKRGLLDRHFKSKLEVQTPATTTKSTLPSDVTVYVNDGEEQNVMEQLTDLSAQNSYDLPPVSAAEMGLQTVRSLLATATASEEGESDEQAMISMCFYGIEGVRFAILSSQELYTGNTNTGWRYDFATSDVMEPVVHRVTLQKKVTRVDLRKSELEEALRFHLVTMRLACMHVDDAMRDVDIAGGKVWNEFSEQNDKGYLVVPSRLAEDGQQTVLDWEYLRDIISKPLLLECWPLPAAEDLPPDEWVCVPTHRRNVSFVVKALLEEKAGEKLIPTAKDDAAWSAHMKAKAVNGVPRFGRWHTRDQTKDADADQPLIHGVQVPEIVPLIRRVMQRNLDEGSTAQSKTKFGERFLLPQYTSLLRMTKTRYFEAKGIVPLLYEFERKCQMSNLMKHIGMEVDLALLDDATTKPAYERLEILGDTFLKLETSWYLFENRRDITAEGDLSQLRRDIIRNDRLNMFALAKNLHRYMLDPSQIEQHPFKFWKPSCMGMTPDSIIAPSKWIADVLEAIVGAYLVGHGESGARHFLQWVGVAVPKAPQVIATSYYPDCFPNQLSFTESDAVTRAQQRDLGFRVDEKRFEDIPDRLVAVQQRLKYTFRNKLLLLEAISHPSVGAILLTPTDTDKQIKWRGNYERLEYLGDAVIEYLTLSYAFTTYAKWLPGSITQWKSATVSNDALGKTAIMFFGIDECLLSGMLRIDPESLGIVAKMERHYEREPAMEKNGAALQRVSTAGKPPQKRKAPPAANAINSMALPKMFADVFEALVAAVFLDSGHNLQTVRDVFLGPLLDAVGKDAYAYVCHQSGLPMDDAGGSGYFEMEELKLFSDDEDDDCIELEHGSHVSTTSRLDC